MNLSSGLPAGSSNAQGLPLEVAEKVKKEMPSGPQGIVDRVAKEAAAPLGKQLLRASPFFVFGLGRYVPAWTDGFAVAGPSPLALKGAL